jgi:hypothetical protein
LRKAVMANCKAAFYSSFYIRLYLMFFSFMKCQRCIAIAALESITAARTKNKTAVASAIQQKNYLFFFLQRLLNCFFKFRAYQIYAMLFESALDRKSVV